MTVSIRLAGWVTERRTARPSPGAPASSAGVDLAAARVHDIPVRAERLCAFAVRGACATVTAEFDGLLLACDAGTDAAGAGDELVEPLEQAAAKRLAATAPTAPASRPLMVYSFRTVFDARELTQRRCHRRARRAASCLV